MRPLDSHAHAGRWLLPAFAGRQSSLAEARQIYVRWNWAGALLLPTDEGDSLSLLAAVSALPKGPVDFRVAFWADPRKPDNLDAFQAHAQSFAALKIHPSCLRMPATDPAFGPFCEVASAARLPILVHCGRWQEVSGFRHALALAARFPGIPFILGHMGGDSPDLVTAAVETVAAARLDLVHLGTESIREPWLLELAIQRLGPSRIVFGSDYNLNHPEPFRRLIEVLDITDQARQRILRDNLNSLLPEQHRFHQPQGENS
jgi:predicted TIM-barrel fold metal-dependent hydrolase